jgi:anti-anti-sigma factor
VPITLDQNKGLCLVRLEGEVNISSAAELKKILIEALATRKELHVDLEHASELDITALQLLWAAEREARGSSVGFTLVGDIPEAISATLVGAGFEKFPIPPSPK